MIPVQGGVSLDTGRMNRILSVDTGDLSAVVQPGVTRLALNERLGRDGLQFPVDPGADASLGGMAATNASGTTTVRYGGMRAHVLALEVVLPGGRVIRTGSRARKSSAGYDVGALFVGSEGTLGVITELTLRVHGIPEHAVAIRIVFESLDDACAAAVAIVGAGVSVVRLELLDAETLRAVNAYKGTALEEAPSLFVELAGSAEGVAGDLEAVRELAGGYTVLRGRARPDRTRPPLGGTASRRLRARGGNARPGAPQHRRLRAGLAPAGGDPPRPRRARPQRALDEPRRPRRRRQLPRALRARPRRSGRARAGADLNATRSSSSRSRTAARAPASTASASGRSATSSASTATCCR